MTSTIAAQEQSAPQTGLLDLEKELTCSICTDLLFQPLTLLDCLHTFCGSCLKEWFLWQKAAAKQKGREQGRSATYSQNVYTCPSCRAPVRETRPNATVTTLLDMYLQANPTKGKTEKERSEVTEHYKAGENVLPDPPSPSPSRAGRSRRDAAVEDAEDRALVEEVRQMSLRELERQGTRSNRGERETDRDARNRRRTRMLNASSANRDRTAPRDRNRGRIDRSPREAGEPQQPQQPSSRSLEHQSSLRSLISSSDLESLEMEEEIMRQILEEGLLDGIDLSNINRQEEDEISERIAQAYRSRQRDRARGVESAERQPPRTTENQAPPSSYHADHTPRSGARSSSQGSSSSTRRHQPARTSSEQLAGTNARAATEPSEISDSRSNASREHRRMLSSERRSTDPHNGRSRGSPRVSIDAPRATSEAVSTNNSSRETFRSASLPVPTLNLPQESSQQDQSLPREVSTANESVTGHEEAAVTTSTQDPGPRVSTPFLYCSGCSRPRIQHELHYICSKCPPTTGSNVYALCMRCYQTGHGCPHWYGFGEGALHRYAQQRLRTASGPPPHAFTSEKFVKIEDSTTDGENLSFRVRGVFCDICHESANECYWRCPTCNDGEWGFCNTCVNKARHCTHPLLPLFWNQTIQDVSGAGNTGPESSPSLNPTKPKPLEPLPIHTTCNSCRNPIPPSTTRYHCPTCQEGNYDICTLCYTSLVSTGKISRENGPHGWRKCESGHRMLVVGFESRPEGQRRIVVESVVGGWQMRDEDTTTQNDHPNNTNTTSDPASRSQGVSDREGEWSWRDTSSGSWKSTRHSTISSKTTNDSTRSTFPPSGGYGAKMSAIWTHLPEEGDEDELMFPKRAQITEVLSINEDWCWGVYCGKGGLLPKAFVRIDR